MNLNKIIRLADLFYILASKKEKLPEDSNSLDKILENIEKLKNYQSRKEYAEKNLKHLSSGSSRIVYLTPQKTVVKLAKNDKGIAQNMAESNPKMISKFLNKIINKSLKGIWIETNYLNKITEKDFKKMTGLDFNDFGSAIKYGLKDDTSDSNKSKPKNFDKISKSEIYKEMKKIGEKFHLLPGDMARISSFGEKNNHPVLIDAGLTKEIFEKYYDSN